MAKRKTFSVEGLVDTVNQRNRDSTCSKEIRKGWNSILVDILNETGNYHGFGYLTAAFVPDGEKPGMEYDTTMGFNVFPDDTRIYYIKEAKES